MFLASIKIHNKSSWFSSTSSNSVVVAVHRDLDLIRVVISKVVGLLMCNLVFWMICTRTVERSMPS